MRFSDIARKTSETEVRLRVDLDGVGKSLIDTGCGFFDHMLTLFAKHGRFDLDIRCVGDKWVDYHHSVEDVGISLGMAFLDAMGEKKGIVRYSDRITPMDEALVLCAVDISGRGYLSFDVDFETEKIGDFDTQLVEEFLMAFVREAKITLHVKKLDGKNSHHVAEAVFKCLGRAMREAASVDPLFADDIPSTKGAL